MKSKERRQDALMGSKLDSLQSFWLCPRVVKATKLEATRPKLLATYTEGTGFARSATFSGYRQKE